MTITSTAPAPSRKRAVAAIEQADGHRSGAEEAAPAPTARAERAQKRAKKSAVAAGKQRAVVIKPDPEEEEEDDDHLSPLQQMDDRSMAGRSESADAMAELSESMSNMRRLSLRSQYRSIACYYLANLRHRPIGVNGSHD